MSEADPGRLNKVLSSINESVLMCGHTHNPFNIKIKEKYYINPGSVGQPKKRFAEYFVLVVDKEDLKTIQRPVPYDIEKVKIAFIKSGYLDEGGICAKMNILSLETGKSYFTPFKNYAREYARNVGFNGKDIPKEILIEASESWDWIV